MRLVKTHTFRGNRYKIEIEKIILDGCCESVKEGSLPKLRVFTGLDSKKGLETVIHEALHACCFAKSEEIVNTTAKDVAKFLWRLGYRKN